MKYLGTYHLPSTTYPPITYPLLTYPPTTYLLPPTHLPPTPYTSQSVTQKISSTAWFDGLSVYFTRKGNSPRVT